MKSVLFINYEYPPVGAGGANATLHFARYFASCGITTSVLTSAFKTLRGTSSEHGVTVHRIAAGRTFKEQSSILQMICFTLSACLHLPRIIRHHRPDRLIVFFSIPCGPVGLLARLWWHIPYTVMLRGGDVPGSDYRLHRLHTLLTPLRRYIYNKSTAVVVNSESLRTQAEKADPDFGYAVIPNGVDTDFFSPLVSAHDNPGIYTFLFSGRICPQKNIDLLLTAFSRCLKKGIRCRLVIAGNGPDRKRLTTLDQTHSLGKALIWYGWLSQEQLRSLYRNADCLVNPSRNEGHPNAVLEAMACGLPVIASNCAGNSDIITDTHNGLLFSEGNAAALGEAMLYIATHNQYGRDIGIIARATCMAQYSWESSGAQLVSIAGRNYHETPAF